MFILTEVCKDCARLTDLPILELAQLPGLRRLHMNGLRRVTDVGLLALAEHARGLAHLHVACCKRLSLDALHTALRYLPLLQRFTASGIPAMARVGVVRFSEPEPEVRVSLLCCAFMLSSVGMGSADARCI